MDIFEAAARVNLTGPKFMWLLTSFSVGELSRYAHKSIPVGTLGRSHSTEKSVVIVFLTSKSTIFSYIRKGLPGKQMIKCHAQRHNAVPLVML